MGNKCQHSYNDGHCVSQKQCNYFRTNPNKISNLDDQKYCQQHQDLSNFTCNYKQGDTYCLNPQSKCSDYKVYGDLNNNRVLCQNLFPKSNPIVQCDYGSQGDICQDLNCTIYIGTSSFCTTTSCDIIQPNTQEKAYFCQQWKNKQSSNCVYMSSSNICSTSISCSDYLAYGTDIQTKTNYCLNIVLQNQKTCGYISGDACSSCNQIQAQGSDDTQKQSFCTSINILQQLKCSYQIGDQFCYDIICEDFEQINQKDCLSYKPTCDFNYNLGICYKKINNCQKYIIPYEIQNSQDILAKYCSGFYIINSSIPCVYDPSITESCSSPKECDSISLYNIEMCAITHNNNGQLCGSYGWRCQNLTECQNYIYYQIISDLHFQYTSQYYSDANGLPCYAESDGSVRRFTSSKYESCSQYLVYGSDIPTNRYLCQRIFTSNNIQCDYEISGQQCMTLDCTQYYGTNDFCYTKSCETIIPSTSNKSIYCQQFINTNGINCSLLQNQNQCSQQSFYCTDFVAYGSDKVQKNYYCLNMIPLQKNRCIYHSGNNCTSCSNIAVINGTNEQQYNYCKSISSGDYQCGYSGEVNCSDKSCNDQGLITKKLCNDHLNECEFHSILKICYKKADSCQKYNIPKNIINEDKTKYCSEVKPRDSQISCIYTQELPDFCQSPRSCNNLLWYQCSLVLNQSGNKCLYVENNSHCIDVSECTNYIVPEQYSLMEKYIFCQNKIDINGFICNFKPGNLNCLPPQASCSDYDAIYEEKLNNQLYCSRFSTNTNPSLQCFYQTSGSVCETWTSDNKFIIVSECPNQIPELILNMNYIEKARFCQNHQKIGYDNLENCVWSINSTYCRQNQNGCNDFVAIGNDYQQKLDYCSSLIPQCVYDEGIFCQSCNQIYPPFQDNQNKYLYCKSIKSKNGVNLCGYYLESNSCNDISCGEYGLIDIQSCRNYLPVCEFNIFVNQCYLKQQNCNLYSIYNVYSNTMIHNTQYCQQYFEKESGLQCTFDDSQHSCQQNAYIQQQNFFVLDQKQKAQFCSIQNQIANTNAYDSKYQSCINISACSNYFVTDSESEIVIQELCSYNIDSDGFFCSYKSGESTCLPPQSQCSDYQVYGKSKYANKLICQKLFANQNPPIQCDYIDGPVCQNRNCPSLIENINFCNVPRCQNINTQSTDYSDKAFYCQQFINYYQMTCVYQAGNYCNDSQYCQDFVAYGDDQLQKIDYCASLQFNQYTNCVFYGVNQQRCINCSNIKPDQGNDFDKQIFCQQMSKATYIYCDYSISTGYCKNRLCNDYGLNNARICRNYLPQCEFNFKVNKCYQKFDSCSKYSIPLQFQDYQEKALYCSGVILNGQFQQCVYDGSFQRKCSSPPKSCKDYQILFSYGQSQICQLLINESGQKCIANDYQNICNDPTYCDQYKFIYSQLSAQEFCQNQQDINGYYCNYKLGEQFCQPPQQKCSDYYTYGNNIKINKKYCQKLFTNSNPSIQCDYGSSGSTCQDYNCNNTPQQNSYLCELNKACTQIGNQCQQKQKNCYEYQGDSQIICSKLLQIDGTYCGWSQGQQCSLRQCEQFQENPSINSCQQYLPTCQFNGQTCQSPLECFQYAPYGINNQEKAQICNNLKNVQGIKCTYIFGEINCTDIKQCDNYRFQSQSSAISLEICSQLYDMAGNQCGWITGNTCAERNCNQSQDESCNQFMVGCENATGQFCELLTCQSAPVNLNSDQQCEQFRNGCRTNGNGCVDFTDNCSAYNGDQVLCQRFIGSSGTIPCTNYVNSKINDSCVNRTCNLNTTAKNDSDCNQWIPRINNQIQCVWNGNQGCVNGSQKCSEFQGTIDTCTQFTAADGPCSGQSSIIKPCVANSEVCTHAPINYKTDYQCKQWHNKCMSNGIGCISIEQAKCQDIISMKTCNEYKNIMGCGVAKSCKTRQIRCVDHQDAQDCINTPLIGQITPNCVWDAQLRQCSEIKCSLLPYTLTTHKSCSQYLQGCTTTGSGCVTIGSCSSYSKYACNNALSTDPQKYCMWEYSQCRPIQCSDNQTSKTDSECNKYLVGCRTIGKGCLDQFSCSIFIQKGYCLTDSNNNPCIWFNQKCITYSKCDDYQAKTHSECQQISYQCTTNGNNCISITSCMQTLQQISCKIGTDGICGWLPQNINNSSKCSLYTKCSDADGTTLKDCQLWGPNCVSNSINCIDKQLCQNYADQNACNNQGVDGKCVWVLQTQKCKLEECSDNNISNHEECYALQLTIKCTTNSTNCIPIIQCQQYKLKVSCNMGTDGQCIWDNQSCRLQKCEDYLLSTSQQCKQIIGTNNCVSNGNKCIQQLQCSQYTLYESCLGGGIDGQCAFKPSNNTNTGTCIKFQQCSDANYDKIACNNRQDQCYYNQTINNSSIESQCQNHTCITKQIGTICQSIPSFDLKSYEICILNGNQCIQGNPQQFNSQNCFISSFGTYTWNSQYQRCNACKKVNVIEQDQISQNNWQCFLNVIILNLLI